MFGRIVLVGALVVIAAVALVTLVQPQPVAVPTSSPRASSAAPTASPTVARPSPTPVSTPTLSPTTSPVQPLPPVGCPTLSGGSSTAQAQVTAIRTAHQPGIDRIVFEFGPSGVGPYGLPPWSISIASSFIGTSGQRVPVDGNAFLRVNFQNASTVDPQTGKQTFTQTDIHPGLPLVRNVKLVEDFERVMIWGIGLERLACPTVIELANPARLVVDLPTPP